MTTNDPLVTVNILSFNRKDDLRNTLKHVFEQDYKNIEVIVVDNASSDGTGEMIRTEYPSVKLIQLQKNIGIAGWNEGFKAAKGEFVLVLDDDSYPEIGTIGKGVELFQQKSVPGIVAFKVYNSRMQKTEKIRTIPKPLMFIGCGALIPNEIITVVGVFNDRYFIYNHELDYSARCYDNHYEVYYHEDAVVIHQQSVLSRGETFSDPFTSEYRFYHHFLSYSTFLLQNFSLPHSIKNYCKLIVNRFIVCIVFGFYGSFFKALLSTLRLSAENRRTKQQLRPEIQALYNYGNLPFIDRDFFPSF